jgi:acetoin utilization deacetylase AcuC-like enzyme
MYHFLSEDDYHWLTEKLCEASSDGDHKTKSRVVSILEGGYSLSSIASKALGGKIYF